MRENKIDYEDSLTTTQLNWMKDVQNEAFNAGVENTFIFTHAPIVGGGGLKTSIHTQNRIEFVEWANGDDTEYTSGGSVRAVFAGHTHQTHAFGKDLTYKIDSTNMDKPEEIFSQQVTIPYSWHTVYIESASIDF